MGRPKKIVDPNAPIVPKRPRGRPRKNPVAKITHVALVIDRSGSMSNIREAALSAINEQIQTFRENADKGGKTDVTFVQFDDVIDVLYERKPAKELVDLTIDQFVPRNSTAMRDAVGRAIAALESAADETPDTGYLVVVISDGYENASREWSRERLADKIKELQATGKWTFTYMLSNQDLSVVTQQLGLHMNNVAGFAPTAGGMRGASVTMSTSTANYLMERSIGSTSTADFYTPSTTTNIKPEDLSNATLTVKTPT